MGSGPAELVSLAELNFLGTAGSGQRGTVVSGVDLRDIRDMGPTWKKMRSIHSGTGSPLFVSGGEGDRD